VPQNQTELGEPAGQGAGEATLASRRDEPQSKLDSESDATSSNPISFISRILNIKLTNESEVEQALKSSGLSDKAINAVKKALRILSTYPSQWLNDVLGAKFSSRKTDMGHPDNYDRWEGYDKRCGKGKPNPTAKAEERARRDELVRKAALGIVTSRDEAWEAIQRAAQAMFGRSDGHGIEWLLQTPLGCELYRAYLDAPAAPPPAPVTKTASDDLDMDLESWREIVSLAEGMVQKSDRPMTREQAIAAIMDTARGKALYRRYLSEKAAKAVRRR
jgi:hypothetical protein